MPQHAHAINSLSDTSPDTQQVLPSPQLRAGRGSVPRCLPDSPTPAEAVPDMHFRLQAVTTAMGVQHGFGSSLFAMALCFSLIVMYDAAGVRRHAGAQAEVLNTVVQVRLGPSAPGPSAPSAAAACEAAATGGIKAAAAGHVS